MGVRFTEEQERAIKTLDKSILVSAAAGSGKTAVLVERILGIILEGRANVDEMLIVTFTKAAAAEMRLRLAKAIRAGMKEKPEDAPRLRDQLGRLYRAYISTIDSFALRIIREFFYETDIDPDASACDEVTGELLRREAINGLFEDGFEDDDFVRKAAEEGGSLISAGAGDAAAGVGFREFLRLYSEERSEETIKDNMIEAYSRLRSIPDYFEWAYRMAENLRTAEDDFGSSEIKRIMTADAAESIGNAAEAVLRLRDLMYGAGLKDMFDEKLGPETDEILALSDEIRTGGADEGWISRIGGLSFVTLRASKTQKEAYDPVKNEVKLLRAAYKDEISDWRKRYLEPDLGTRIREMGATYPYTLYYIRLLEEFEKRYAALKAEKKVMDFADMEHGAVAILKNEAASEVMRKRFKYIFVDEYQDTNNIQEYLIGKVSRPDNVFKVGDVKQSIYKFRQAEPEIFERVYREYSDPEKTDGIAIDLSKNFRSNDRTIRYINRVFREVMDGYDGKAMLYTGCECPPEYDFVPEVHVLFDDEDEGSAEPEEADDTDAEISDLSREEAEAEYIADIASGLIGTEFYDTKAGLVRRAEARDIVILFRAVRLRGDVMARALRGRGIEPHVEESDDYFDTVEISTALSLLMCIDNMKRDVPLIASLHSAAFGWSPAELGEIRIAHSAYLRESGKNAKGGPRPAYYEAFDWYRTEGPEGSLKEKARSARARLLEWRRLSGIMPLEDFIWMLLTDSGLYSMTGAMNGGAKRQANLRALADRAGRYTSETVSSLSSFITFLDALRKRKISTGQTSTAGSEDNVIRISTIHKSKGLEYPFVIIGGLGHRFRKDGNEKKLSFDSAIGLGLPYIDPDRKFWRSTMVQRAINAKSGRDAYHEELRVLYVAMTRARNKLIMVGTADNPENLAEYTSHPGNFLKVMRDVIRTADNSCFIKPLDKKGGTESSGAYKEINIPSELSGDAALVYEEIDRRFSYVYPDAELLTAKTKYSVSELRRLVEKEAAGLAGGRDKAGGPERPDEGGPSVSSGYSDASDVTELYDYDAAAAALTGDGAGEIESLHRLIVKRKKAGAAEIGTAYHRIMEFLDFARTIGPDGNADEGYIRSRAEALRGSGGIDPQVFEAVDPARIAGFFACDAGRRAAAAAARGSLLREKPFTLRTTGQGRPMLVQGVIDCCFEENGSMILIDYKSSFIRPWKDHDAELERIRKEYRVQIELYAEAITKGTGLPVSEAYLYLFSSDEPLRMI